jgi:hypothetical protein
MVAPDLKDLYTKVSLIKKKNCLQGIEEHLGGSVHRQIWRFRMISTSKYRYFDRPSRPDNGQVWEQRGTSPPGRNIPVSSPRGKELEPHGRPRQATPRSFCRREDDDKHTTREFINTSPTSSILQSALNTFESSFLRRRQQSIFPSSKANPPPTTMTDFMDIDLSRRNEKPRPLSDAEKQKLEEFVDSIHYSGR